MPRCSRVGRGLGRMEHSGGTLFARRTGLVPPYRGRPPFASRASCSYFKPRTLHVGLSLVSDRLHLRESGGSSHRISELHNYCT